MVREIVRVEIALLALLPGAVGVDVLQLARDDAGFSVPDVRQRGVDGQHAGIGFRGRRQNEHGIRQRQELQRRARNEGIETLLEELRRIDPIAAEKLHLRDEKRIIRALEVWQETGRTITEHDRLERQQPPKYDALYIGLDFIDRQDLRDRIDRRVDIMVEQGLLAEVKALLDSGLPRDATALQAIGYKQFLAVAEGTATTEEAIAEVKLRSRQYAKRQLTWLRRNPDIFWVRWQRQPNFPEGLQKATEYLHSRGLC